MKWGSLLENLKLLWLKIFPLTLTKKFYLSIVLITLIPMLVIAIMFPITTYKTIKLEKQKILYAVVDRLSIRLNTSYEDILKKHNALGQSKEQQAKILNNLLQPKVNSLAKSFPEVGMGYYSIELDGVLAIYPELKPFQPFKVAHSTPYFNIYKTGEPEFGESNNSIGWQGKPVFWYAHPIMFNGKIVGHTWANVKTESIFQEMLHKSLFLFGAWLIIIFALLFLSNLVFKKIRRGLEDFAQSIVSGETMPETNLPELKPILCLIKEHNLKIQEQASALSSSKDQFMKVFKANPLAMSLVEVDIKTFEMRFI